MVQTQRVKFSELAHFTDKQRKAQKLVEDNKYVLYGGAMGGGKSYWLRWQLLLLLLTWAAKGIERVTVALFCEDYPALKDRHLSKVKYEFPEWLGTFNASEHNFQIKPEFGGGVLAFRNLDDPSKYQSSEFAAEGVDELTKNPKETFDFLRTRLRWPGIKDTKFIAASNPGGVGHEWVKRLWLDREFDPLEAEKNGFVYVPAKAVDNPHIDPSYLLSLAGLPEEMRKAFIDGDWNLFKGQYFKEWRQERHVIAPFNIPPSWRRFRAYDHGRDAPACCLWFAVDNNGRVWVYREFYARELNVDQIASEIKRLSVGEEYELSLADPAIFANTGYVDRSGGQTIAETFARYGVTFIPASNRRVDGWGIMHQFLYWEAETAQNPIGKPPKITFFNNCVNSIRTIPSLIHNEVGNIEDLDSGGEDHAADVVRYFLVMLHEGKSKLPKTSIQQKMDKIKDQNVQSSLSGFYNGDFYRSRMGR